jgi:MscS family membrane protein
MGENTVGVLWSFYVLSEINIESIFSYELITGNALWRFGLVLLGILVTLIVGKIVQFVCMRIVDRNRKKKQFPVLMNILDSISKPIYIAIFAAGLHVCETFLVFDKSQTAETIEGLDSSIQQGWTMAVKIILAFAVGYAVMKLVDVLEAWLMKAADKTETSLDNMLVPILRRSMRITIVLITILFIMDLVIGLENIKSILVGAGVGGLAIALAARETVANLIGSITIFADRPFQIHDLIQLDGQMGFVEDVGFRSTRIRTWDGHLITIPNDKVINTTIDNLGARPAIRRKSDITITYDSGAEKAEGAVQIIKDILTDIPEIDTHPHRNVRVYFNEFNSDSLNIKMIYWVKPADWWLFNEVNEKVNLELMRRFAKANIEFAFPTQTLYLKNDNNETAD